MFITIYGINNIGKTTQANRLVDRLKKSGKKVEYLKYPVYSIKPSGPFLDKILRSGNPQGLSEQELQMWFTLNRYQFEPQLKKMLTNGRSVIAEDYIGTGIAWGVTKGLDREWLEQMNKYLLKEDLSILMDGVRSIQSKEPSHIHEGDDRLVEKCRQVYLALAKRYGWKIVQMSKVWDETTERLWHVLGRVMDKG